MKFYISLAFLFLLSTTALAQEYNLSTTQQPYTYLDAATVLVGDEDWDDPIVEVNIGFDFIFHGDTFQNVFISDDISFDTAGNDYVDAIYLDYVDRDENSLISTQLIEENGFKILKIEWRNVGLYQEEEDLGTTNDSLNVQVWLHEGTNDISVHMGPHSIPSDIFGWDTGAYIGIWKEDVILQKEYYYYVAGAPTNPELVYQEAAVSGVPENGYVYTFEYNPPNLSTPSNRLLTGLSVYPNPAHNNINIGLDCEFIQLIDLTGKTILEKIEVHANQVIDVSTVGTGMYLIQAKLANGQMLSEKLVIQ